MACGPSCVPRSAAAPSFCSKNRAVRAPQWQPLPAHRYLPRGQLEAVPEVCGPSSARWFAVAHTDRRGPPRLVPVDRSLPPSAAPPCPPPPPQLPLFPCARTAVALSRRSGERARAISLRETVGLPTVSPSPSLPLFLSLSMPRLTSLHWKCRPTPWVGCVTSRDLSTVSLTPCRTALWALPAIALGRCVACRALPTVFL